MIVDNHLFSYTGFCKALLGFLNLNKAREIMNRSIMKTGDQTSYI